MPDSVQLLVELFELEHSPRWETLFDSVSGWADTYFRLRLWKFRLAALGHGVPQPFDVQRVPDGLRLVYRGAGGLAPAPREISHIVTRGGMIDDFAVNGHTLESLHVDLGSSSDGNLRAFAVASGRDEPRLMVLSESTWTRHPPTPLHGLKPGLEAVATLEFRDGSKIVSSQADLPAANRAGDLLALVGLGLAGIDAPLSRMRIDVGRWTDTRIEEHHSVWMVDHDLRQVCAAGDGPMETPGNAVIFTDMGDYLRRTGGQLLVTPAESGGWWTDRDSERLGHLRDRFANPGLVRNEAALADARDAAATVLKSDRPDIWVAWQQLGTADELLSRLAVVTLALSAEGGVTAVDLAEAAEAAMILMTDTT